MTNTTDTEIKYTCSECKYWFAAPGGEREAEEGPHFGNCKRNPPLLLNLEGNTYTGFPMIVDTEWCGEFNKK
jgi:hypothetical protein